MPSPFDPLNPPPVLIPDHNTLVRIRRALCDCVLEALAVEAAAMERGLTPMRDGPAALRLFRLKLEASLEANEDAGA